MTDKRIAGTAAVILNRCGMFAIECDWDRQDGNYLSIGNIQSRNVTRQRDDRRSLHVVVSLIVRLIRPQFGKGNVGRLAISGRHRLVTS